MSGSKAAERKFVAETLRVSDVVVRQGRRPISDALVSQLVESIAQSGLLEPILVTSDRVLIAGAHRLEAFRRIGLDLIDARVAYGIEEVAAEIAELDENLIRAPLSNLEEKRAWLRRKKLYLRLHPETERGTAGGKASGRARRTVPNLGVVQDDVPSFVADTAEKLGKSPATIAAGVKLAEDLAQDVDAVVQGTPVASNAAALRRIADEGDPMAQVERAKDEVERAKSPRAEHLRVIEGGSKTRKLNPRRVEALAFDEQVRAALQSGKTVVETAKELGCDRQKVQHAKGRVGLSKKMNRDPFTRISDTAVEFGHSLRDLMSCAEEALGSITAQQARTTVAALDELITVVRGIQKRLNKDAAKGKKA